MKFSFFRIKGRFYNISCIEYVPKAKIADFAVVCLHGFGGDKESSAIKRLAERITERGGAVIGFDFASHGESEAQDEMLTVDNCISDTKTIYAYAKNKYGRAEFFATSFGAFVLINMLKSADFKEVKAVFRAPAVKMEDTFLNPICNLTSAELGARDSVVCGFQRKMKLGYDFWLDLKNHNTESVYFENQVLMIYGDKDDVVRVEDMEAFAAQRPNIKVKVVTGADHRFKGKGQLDEVIESAVEFLI